MDTLDKNGNIKMLGLTGPSGFSGQSGTSGVSGFSGQSGTSGFSGVGLSGFSGTSGMSGASGQSGTSGFSGMVADGSIITVTNSVQEGITVSFADLTFDTNNSLVGGDFSHSTSVNTNRILINNSGNFTISYGFVMQNAKLATGQIKKNGTTVLSGSTLDGTLGPAGTALYAYSFTQNLSAGDYITLQLKSASNDNAENISLSVSRNAAGASGVSGFSAFSGQSGTSGFSGQSGTSGTSGFSGQSGTSGFTGQSGVSGFSAFSGQSGISGASGASGSSGFSGQSGTSGFSAFSGQSGTSGSSGTSGTSGTSGFSGISSQSGVSGFSGPSGISGFSSSAGGAAINYFINPRMQIAQRKSQLGGAFSLITANGSSGFSGFANTNSVFSGMVCSGTGVPANARIINVDSFSHCYINGNATTTSNANIIQFWQTGSTVSGSSGLSTLQNTNAIYPGMTITANGVPQLTPIVSVDNNNHLWMSANATATASNVGIQFGCPSPCVGTIAPSPGPAAGVSGQFCADRWMLEASDVDRLSQYQLQFVPNSGPNSDSDRYLQIFSQANPSSTPRHLEQRIENVRSFAGQTLTLSFWAQMVATVAPLGNTTQAVTVNCIQHFGSGGSADVTTAIATPTFNTTMTQYSYTFTVPSISGKSLSSSENGWVSFEIKIVAQVGSTTFCMNFADFILSSSTVTNPFRPIEEELGLCQRYCVFFDDNGAGQGYNFGTTTARILHEFPTSMRTHPVQQLNGGGGSWSTIAPAGAAGSPVTPTDNSTTSTDRVLFYYVVSGVTAGQPVFMVPAVSYAYMFFDAEV
jgi:hypothetical protein